jgi:OmpA-OmpF porin, OOP family
MGRLTVVAVVLALFANIGCAPNRENIRTCVPMATIAGALIGGTAAGVSTAKLTDDNGAGAGAGAGGAIVGGLVGYLLANEFCELPPQAPPAYAPPPPPAPPSGRIETLSGPSFDFNKATLTAEGRAHVDHAIQVMRENPTIRVSVEGHTDSVGSDGYNMKLSQRRAATVRDYMVSHGIAAGRLTTKGYGKTHPIATNSTAEGRAENRRVEIIAQ